MGVHDLLVLGWGSTKLFLTVGFLNLAGEKKLKKDLYWRSSGFFGAFRMVVGQGGKVVDKMPGVCSWGSRYTGTFLDLADGPCTSRKSNALGMLWIKCCNCSSPFKATGWFCCASQKVLVIFLVMLVQHLSHTCPHTSPSFIFPSFRKNSTISPTAGPFRSMFRKTFPQCTHFDICIFINHDLLWI